jgi:hypothetical protein
MAITISGADFAVILGRARSGLLHTIVSSKLSAQGTMGGYDLRGLQKRWPY